MDRVLRNVIVAALAMYVVVLGPCQLAGAG